MPAFRVEKGARSVANDVGAAAVVLGADDATKLLLWQKCKFSSSYVTLLVVMDMDIVLGVFQG